MGERIIAEEPLSEQKERQGGPRAWEFLSEHEDRHGNHKIALKVVELPGEPPCEAFECFGKYGERLGTLKAYNLEEKENAAKDFDYYEEHRRSAESIFQSINYHPEDNEDDFLPEMYDEDEDGNIIRTEFPKEPQTRSLFDHNVFIEKGWEEVEVSPGLKETRTRIIENHIRPSLSPQGEEKPSDVIQRGFLDTVMTYEVGGVVVDKALLEKLGVKEEETLHEAVMGYIDYPYYDKYKRVIVDQNMTEYKYEDIAQDLPLDLCLICHPAGALPILSDKHLREIATTLAVPSSLKYSDYLENSYWRLDDVDKAKEASFYVLNATPNHTLVARADTVDGMEYLDELMRNFREEYPNEKELTDHPYFYDAKTHELTKDGGILKEHFAEHKMEAEQQAKTQEIQAPRRRGR